MRRIRLRIVRSTSLISTVLLAAGSIVDRSGGHADVGTPRVALVTLDVVAYDPAECPLCARGVPAVKPGSRPG